MSRRNSLIFVITVIVLFVSWPTGSRLRANGAGISVIPTLDSAPDAFFAACENMASWPTVLGNTQYLGVTNDVLAAAAVQDEERVTDCFANMTNAGIELILEIGVLKECGSGTDCFWSTYGDLDLLVNELGAPLGALQMDEPMDYGTRPSPFPEFSLLDAAYETVIWMGLVREYFPGVKLIETEPLGHIGWLQHLVWMYYLDYWCDELEEALPEVYQLDHDMAWSFSWYDVGTLVSAAHGWGMDFGIIFWGRGDPSSDHDWFDAAVEMAYQYDSHGITADHYTIESWDHYPEYIYDETYQAYSFMFGVKAMMDYGFLPS